MPSASPNTVPIVAQHETWVSLDPIQGCPATCDYCFLGPQHLTHRAPRQLCEPSALYDALLDTPHLGNPHRFDALCIGNYTDMCLTPANRAYFLAVLREHRRRLPDQPLCVITKAVLSERFLDEVAASGVAVVFFISLSFMPHRYEAGTPSPEQRLENFTRIAGYPQLAAVHFWRPLTPLSVSTPRAVEEQLQQLIAHGARLSVVTGLKFGPSLQTAFQDAVHPLHPYFTEAQQHSTLQHEVFEPWLKETVIRTAHNHNYPTYFHTSCALSYLWGQPDFNATFRPPHRASVCLQSMCPPAQRAICDRYAADYPTPTTQQLRMVSHVLDVGDEVVQFEASQGVIVVDAPLTQAQQTYLTQTTRFPVRGQGLIHSIEWIGSIHRKEISMQVAELVELTRSLIKLFKQVEPRDWGIEAMAVELTAETGTLADSIMIQEGYRRMRQGGELDLEDDVVDIMFMLIRIADYYQIDLEAAYTRMIETTTAKVKARIQAQNPNQP